MYFVYVLHSLKDGRLYTGYTSNLEGRLKMHQDGLVASTQHRRPLRLIHYEAFLLSDDAKRREKFLKGGNGKEELKIMLKTYFIYNKWTNK